MAVNFLQFLVIKPWIRIRIGIQPKMLDPDQMNTDPKPCLFLSVSQVEDCLSKLKRKV